MCRSAHCCTHIALFLTAVPTLCLVTDWPSVLRVSSTVSVQCKPEIC
ncbi:hypothetical protein NP493_668g00023 [Ridgeia piscesae]|uniref:Uncharacterized protein n=1 Tax=Ridgeia piscesae TaxID=27915 RepID=A0AAD9NR21_RIDPI|nr:hypothetical protein NP493_668g00023 [Ridgeia piscesae]